MRRGGEPAMVDVHGGVWVSETEYELDPTAKRYEVYEMNFAAKACALQFCAFRAYTPCSHNHDDDDNNNHDNNAYDKNNKNENNNNPNNSHNSKNNNHSHHHHHLSNNDIGSSFCM